MSKNGINETGFKLGVIATIINDPDYNQKDFKLYSEFELKLNKKLSYVDLVLVYQDTIHILIELKYKRLGFIEDSKVRPKKSLFIRTLFDRMLDKFNTLVDKGGKERIKEMVVDKQFNEKTIKEVIKAAKKQALNYERTYRFKEGVKVDDLKTIVLVGVANQVIGKFVK